MKDMMLVLHFIGLAMGLGTAFAHAFLGFAASKMSLAAATKFKIQTQILGRMGSIGLVLLIVSGAYLIVPFWSSILLLPLLIGKLILVLILLTLLAVLSILERKAKVSQPEVQFKKMEIVGKIALITSVAIVILAVLVFH